MEQGVKERADRYRALFENALEGIFRSTPEGRFLAVNLAQTEVSSLSG